MKVISVIKQIYNQRPIPVSYTHLDVYKRQPGIRPSFATTDDQKRVATPASALQDGASRLVIGRPITQAENPREAVRLIIEEMENVSK